VVEVVLEVVVDVVLDVVPGDPPGPTGPVVGLTGGMVVGDGAATTEVEVVEVVVVVAGLDDMLRCAGWAAVA
jgi:hypothetical protein